MTASSKKTDNHNPEAKLLLRRHFLKKYHGDGLADVLDCCQGSGLLWGNLRKDHQIAKYVGLDLKPKKGRLKIDSARYLDAGGWSHTVVDVDTYGSPWEHWHAILKTCCHSVTVFLTIGQRVTGTVGSLSNASMESLGLTSIRAKIPKGFHPKLAALSVDRALSMAFPAGFKIADCMEAESENRNVRYIGIRIEKTP